MGHKRKPGDSRKEYKGALHTPESGVGPMMVTRARVKILQDVLPIGDLEEKSKKV